VGIIWISDTAPAGLTTDAGIFERHRQASMRFRVGMPARALAALGVESRFVGLDAPEVLAHLTPDRVDAVVFAKLSTPRGPTFSTFVTAYLGTADHARARGLGVVVDLVDNVFATDRSDFFVELVARADVVTVATAALAEICAQHAKVPIQVVADPVEGERRKARFAPPRASWLGRVGLRRVATEPLRLLWFGGQYRNFLDLAALFPALSELATAQPIDLAIVMNPDERIARELASLEDRGPDGLAAHFVEWSLAALSGELERCNLVLLPSDLRDSMRTVASPNRLARALWAGRAVVAHPLPSYIEFRDAALLGADLVDAIRWAVAHPGQMAARIELGQQIVATRYSGAAIGQRWYEVLRSLRRP
jgi:glycosyltransferase involved in cell wall biosynthesis